MKNKKVETLILGSGAGGLGAACWMKKFGNEFLVIDGCNSLPMNLHNGVHYLHKIPSLPFKTDIKEITLTDGILDDDKIHHIPNLEYSLKYSEKVREIQHPSSIMNIGKENKVFMPSSNSLNDLMAEMYEFAGKENFLFGWWLKELDYKNKIAYFENSEGEFSIRYHFLITTIPLDKLLEKSGLQEIKNSLKLECNTVHITNYKVDKIVPNWMINLYVPDPRTPVYRVSILNNVCSVESIRELTVFEESFVLQLLNMFHIEEREKLQKYEWSTGKVMSISIDERAELIETLGKHHIYSLGRFGLWNRKLMIDSTINQAKKICEYLNDISPMQGFSWKELKDYLSK